MAAEPKAKAAKRSRVDIEGENDIISTVMAMAELRKRLHGLKNAVRSSEEVFNIRKVLQEEFRLLGDTIQEVITEICYDNNKLVFDWPVELVTEDQIPTGFNAVFCEFTSKVIATYHVDTAGNVIIGTLELNEDEPFRDSKLKPLAITSALYDKLKTIEDFPVYINTLLKDAFGDVRESCGLFRDYICDEMEEHDLLDLPHKKTTITHGDLDDPRVQHVQHIEIEVKKRGYLFIDPEMEVWNDFFTLEQLEDTTSPSTEVLQDPDGKLRQVHFVNV